MQKFTPKNKLSKREKKALNVKRRTFWPRSPITRAPPKPNAYDRKKVRRETRKTIDSTFSLSHMRSLSRATNMSIADTGRKEHAMSIYKPGRPAKYNPSTGVGTKPPSQPGEYRIRDASGAMQYLGETNNLNRRMNEHIRSGKLALGYTIEVKLADGRSTSRTRRLHEQQKIAQHQPPLNKSIGGEGRPAGK